MESETLCCWKQQCFALLSLVGKQNEGGTYSILLLLIGLALLRMLVNTLLLLFVPSVGLLYWYSVQKVGGLRNLKDAANRSFESFLLL